MDTRLFLPRAKSLVTEYVNRDILNNEMIDSQHKVKITNDDVYVVWLSKTLQNAKALLSIDMKGAPYFEVTLNGDNREIYIDVYNKVDNVKVGLVNVE